MNLIAADKRVNRGHASHVVPDMHPAEVDAMRRGLRQCDIFHTNRGKLGTACASERLQNGASTVTQPGLVFFDGRCYNQRAARLWKEEECRYRANLYPWPPRAPRLHHPRPGHYPGLSMPPQGQCWYLRQKVVSDTASMPTFCLLPRY